MTPPEFEGRIGPYEVERELGRGGMGVVYFARDPRLDRAVAIKGLPEALAGDAGRLERFEREARTLAQLSHPNVAGIHGVEEHAGARYLVLEYVEGETLADRLDRGPLEPDEALELAVQIAAGVEAAHEAGVIHRDLKPGNVMVTPDGRAKVLDFGLARFEGATSVSTSEDPTMTSPPAHAPTAEGAVLGTAPYMSPEQARGRRTDQRTDVWSFGVILYEMLTGAGPFVGETASDSIGAVLHKDVDYARLPAGTPDGVRRALGRALERDRNLRWRDVGDLRIELERARAEPPSGAHEPGRRSPLALVVGAAAVALAGAACAWLLAPRAEPAAPAEALHVGVPIPPEFEWVGESAISRDGRTIAIVARERAEPGRTVESAVYVRRLEEPEFRKVPGSERANGGTFFSPDGERVFLFVSDPLESKGVARAAPLGGGPAVDLFELSGASEYGWFVGVYSDTELLLTSRGAPHRLYKVGLDGRPPEALPAMGWAPSDDLQSVAVPRLGGRYAVVSRWPTERAQPDLERVDLETGETTPLLEEANAARFLDSGHIVFERSDALWVAPFDLDRAIVTGPARLRLTDFRSVQLDGAGERAIYTPENPMRDREQIVLLDGAGEVTRTLVAAGDYNRIAVSRSGDRIAFEEEAYNPRIWTLDMSSGLSRPVTQEDVPCYSARWLPDGRLAYSRWEGAGRASLLVQEARPGAAPEPLLPGGGETTMGRSIEAFSPDGRHVIVSESARDGREPGLYLYDVGDGASGRPFFASGGIEGYVDFHPSGAWVVYATNITGRYEVYLRRFDAADPESGAAYRVTTDGGDRPSWSSDGGHAVHPEQRGGRRRRDALRGGRRARPERRAALLRAARGADRPAVFRGHRPPRRAAGSCASRSRRTPRATARTSGSS